MNSLLEDVSKSGDINTERINVAILDSTYLRSDLSLNDEMISKLETEWNVELPKDLISDFNSKNRLKSKILDKFESYFEYQLFSSKEYSEIIESANSWQIIEEQYPDIKTILSFSRVGLNSDENKALLFVRTNCGPLCGATYYLLFSKSDSKWKLEQEYQVRIS